MGLEDVQIDGFILPGHVSLMIGLDAYRPFFDQYRAPCVVAGFEPVDILLAVSRLVEMIETGHPELENAYPRAVTDMGNTKAQNLIQDIFETSDACWRGIGMIPRSGLKIKEKYARHDTEKRFDIRVPEPKVPPGCACGDILIGKKHPPDCQLYKKVCTPADPVGPCMVSTEGTCAAYYRYHAG
jgi:hydrogenase expression/formation protein HypD